MAGNLPVRKDDPSARSPRRSANLLADFFGFDPFESLWPSYGHTAARQFGIDIGRTEDGYTLELPVAGYQPEQIEVTVQGDTLVLSGKNDRRNFTRSLTLPEEIDPDAITAHVEHGMLTLRLPRRPEVKPRRIDVQTGPTRAAVPTVSGSSGERTAGEVTPGFDSAKT